MTTNTTKDPNTITENDLIETVDSIENFDNEDEKGLLTDIELSPRTQI